MGRPDRRVAAPGDPPVTTPAASAASEPSHERGAAPFSAHSPVVADVLRALPDMAGERAVRLAESFVPIFLGKAPMGLLERSPRELARICLDTLVFLDRTETDRVAAEVLNPEPGGQGWRSPFTVVRTNVSERPFIVDTIREFISSRELQIKTLVYPLMAVSRDENGAVTGFAQPGEEGRKESIVYAEIERVAEPDPRKQVLDGIVRRLEDVVRATDDFGLMVDKVADVISELGFHIRDVPARREEFREVQAFLRWLRDGGFVFLGYREYTIGEVEAVGGPAVMVEPGSGLGVLQDESRSSYAKPVPLSDLPEGMHESALSGPLLIISKTNAESTVHRRARMDYIGVKKLGPDGAVTGEHRFLGLFTSRAYAEAAQDIPILRKKLANVLERSGVAEGSHDYKEIITIFDSLPKEELFLASEEEIHRDVRTILTRYDTEGVIVSLRRDALGRGLSIMVVLPRARFSGGFRRDFERTLVERYDALILNYHLAMSEGDQARLHFYVGGPRERLARVESAELEETVARLTRSWADELRDRLDALYPPEDARRLAQRYAEVFPPDYQAANDPKAAVRDIVELEEMKAAERMESVRFFDDDGGEQSCELRVYIRRHKIVLSDFMPVLENCGLRVIAVSPFELQEDGDLGGSAVYSFEVQAAGGVPVDVEARGDVLAEAVLAVRAGNATDDGFNRLVERTGMAWREAEVLRAYAHYAFQLGVVPTRQVVRTALATHPEVGLLLFRLFEARFDPDAVGGASSAAEAGTEAGGAGEGGGADWGGGGGGGKGEGGRAGADAGEGGGADESEGEGADAGAESERPRASPGSKRATAAREGPREREMRATEAADIKRRIAAGLASVGSLAFDRALRALQGVIDATVRTNYYLTGGRTPTRRSGGVPYVSFKFECERLREVHGKRLQYEVWVRSARMEGVHLRGASVARGGIRHSDREDDFRTEIQGLAYTQMVKNAVIVPGGSKGGFVCLRALADREAMAEEVKAQYRTLIRGLLDVTDNIDGEGVRPERVVCRDGFDPYLVVAADKGTAAFSDLANELAADYGFWLDDAFASGGTNGYDHKVVGITAGGAWESVKRHFREKGKDIQKDAFTVAGIGDMSGDVFGNGMLLSRAIRLVAAFDHRHVFIDPDPDPEASFEERKRLFEMERSSWDDYDRGKLSAGGMIVPRAIKSVDLGDEAAAVLGLPEDQRSLDGESLIKAVLAAPVDLLWNGGIGTYVKAGHESHADAGDRSNDAVRIDVDELRATAVGEGGNLGFTQAARVEYALRGGRINTDALDNSGGVDLSDREVNLKILLNEALRSGDATREERNQLLHRLTDEVAAQALRDNEYQSLAVSLDEYRARRGVDHFWGLMGDLVRTGLLDREAEGLPSWDDLSARREANDSLTRPELAVLLAYAKLHLKSELLASSLPDDPAAAGYFLDYFPSDAMELVGRERAGNHRLRREIVASQLTNDLVDVMGATFPTRMSRETGRAEDEVARAWLVASQLTQHRRTLDAICAREPQVRTGPAYRWVMGLADVLERTTRWVLANSDPGESSTSLVDDNLAELEALRGRFHELVAGEDREAFHASVQQAVRLGVDEPFARNLFALRYFDHLLEILRLARTVGTEPVKAARIYYWVTEELRIPWLVSSIEKATDETNRWERRWSLGLVDDIGAVRRRLTGIALAGGQTLADALDFGGNGSPLDRFHALLDEMGAEETATLAGLSVAVKAIREAAP